LPLRPNKSSLSSPQTKRGRCSRSFTTPPAGPGGRAEAQASTNGSVVRCVAL
jgi:hypothetical protein